MDEEQSVNRYDIILIFQAYNRGEFSYDELIRRTREWVEAMLRRPPGEDSGKNPPESPQ